jgi:cytoskeletal protein CcmA (bactofilin family)
VFKRRKPDDLTTDAAEEADNAASGRADFVVTPPGDTGLGVPPFRPALPPAPPKEASFMSRPPFISAPNPQAPPTGAPSPSASPRPASAPLSGPRGPAREATERRTLVVGRGISVQGTVQDAERLVVEGTVEASMIHATEVSISQGGMFKGEAEVEDAEVAGTFNGTLTVRGNLVIRGTGRVLGQARYRRLQVEDGGQISGQMEMLSDGPKVEAPVRPVPETVD